jgi:hypothetical protein
VRAELVSGIEAVLIVEHFHLGKELRIAVRLDKRQFAGDSSCLITMGSYSGRDRKRFDAAVSSR